MEYQLVIEFTGDSSENFQQVCDLEEMLDQGLRSGKVDGNDVGLGIVNIFIITENPDVCFTESMEIISGRLTPSAAGYRPLEGEDYVRLWPTGDNTPFELR
jgi:hypothetical protein